MCATPSVYLDVYGRDGRCKTRTTPARLQIERDSICQVIVNNKKLSTCLARHENYGGEGMGRARVKLSLSFLECGHARLVVNLVRPI